jgi:hypothetical protein
MDGTIVAGARARLQRLRFLALAELVRAALHERTAMGQEDRQREGADAVRGHCVADLDRRVRATAGAELDVRRGDRHGRAPARRARDAVVRRQQGCIEGRLGGRSGTSPVAPPCVFDNRGAVAEVRERDWMLAPFVRPPASGSTHPGHLPQSPADRRRRAAHQGRHAKGCEESRDPAIHDVAHRIISAARRE